MSSTNHIRLFYNGQTVHRIRPHTYSIESESGKLIDCAGAFVFYDELGHYIGTIDFDSRGYVTVMLGHKHERILAKYIVAALQMCQ